MPEIIPATCVSCQDSSLSTTASIVGILTFVYALLAGLWFYLRSGAKAVATTPAQFYQVLVSISKHAREICEILEIQIEKTGSKPEEEELLLMINGFRLETLELLLQLSRWIGSDREFERYYILEQGRDSIKESDIGDAFRLFHDIIHGYPESIFRSTSGWGLVFPVFLSPTWIGWALRFRWRQGPLRHALDRYEDKRQEIEKLHRRLAARSQRDALRQICEKLERLDRRQEELSTALGVRRTESTELQDGDPLASLMRPRPSQASRSTLSLARDTPLPDIESLP